MPTISPATADSTAGVRETTAERHAAARSHWIDDWRPEDPTFWDESGETDRPPQPGLLGLLRAHRLLDLEPVGGLRAVPRPRVRLRPRQKFLLTTLPTRSAPSMRLPYTFAVAKFGGRNWTIFSSALLLVPAIAAAFVLAARGVVPDAAARRRDRRRRRRQLLLVDGEHRRLLPAAAEGLGARAQRRRRQHRRRRSCSSSGLRCSPPRAGTTRGSSSRSTSR